MQSSDGGRPKVLLNVLVNEELESSKMKVGKYHADRTYQFARYINTNSIGENRSTIGFIDGTIEYSSGETHRKDSNRRKIKSFRATL